MPFFTSFYSFGYAVPRSLHSSLHDALPISCHVGSGYICGQCVMDISRFFQDKLSWRSQIGRCFISRTTECSIRSEEHTSELQSRFDIVCRLLLEKKKKSFKNTTQTDVQIIP